MGSSKLWGLSLVILGVLLVLNSVDYIDISAFFSGWWTLFIIIPCAIRLISKRDMSGNIIGIIIGVFLLLYSQDVITSGMITKLIVPIILVCIGVHLIFRYDMFEFKDLDRTIKTSSVVYRSKNTSSKKAIKPKENTNDDFTHRDINRIFGGVSLMIKNGEIKENTKLDVNVAIGKIRLIVPNDVEVSIDSKTFIGDIIDDREESEITNKSAKLLIEANTLIGGIEISND